MNSLHLQKVHELPESLDCRILYLQRQENGFNAILPNSDASKLSVAFRQVLLSGPETIQVTYNGTEWVTAPTSYHILNYDSFTQYSGEIDHGTLEVSNKHVIIHPEPVERTVYFHVNKEYSRVFVTKAKPQIPELIYPYFVSPIDNVPHVFELPSKFNCYLTAFSSPNSGEIAEQTLLQIADDSLFTQNVQAFTLAGEASIFPVTTATERDLAFIRVGYKGNLSASVMWSDYLRIRILAASHILLTEIGQLTRSDLNASDLFGNSVTCSADGQRVAVLSPGHSGGSIYIYQRSNDVLEYKQTITTSGLPSGAKLNGRIAMSADGTILIATVSSSISSDTKVAVYKYGSTSWSLYHVVTSPSGLATDKFGLSLALNANGSQLFIGAANTTVATSTNAGTVFVFASNSTGYTLVATINSPVSGTNYYFGANLAVSSDGIYLVINEPGVATSDGKIHAYHGNNNVWSLMASFQNTTNPGTVHGSFGEGLQINATGTVIAVGDPLNDKGQVSIYHRSGSLWSEESQKLTDIAAVTGDQYGKRVKFNENGNRLVVTAPATNANQGKAYLYALIDTTWVKEQALENIDASVANLFGYSVAADNAFSNIFVGGPGFNSNRGNVNFFK